VLRRTLLARTGAAASLAGLGAAPQATAQGAEGPAAGSGFRGMRADHVMLGVDDMDRMTTWYRDVLGFEVEKAWTVEGLPGIRLAYLTGHGFRLELIAGGGGPRTPVPASFPEHFTMRGFQHLCFWVDDVDAAVAELERRGVPMFVPATDYPEGAERRVAFVKDPEGNVVELAGPLAGR
jgi:catechol 2,3-dioxygenase-like lactoylglutathione lyase family enzyme